MKTMIQMLITFLEQFGTYYKRFKYFSIHENFIQPVEHIIGIISDECRKNNKVSMILKKSDSYIAYLYSCGKKTLKNFL